MNIIINWIHTCTQLCPHRLPFCAKSSKILILFLYLKYLSPCLFAVSPPQSVLLFHDNICRIALVLAHYSSLLVRTLPGVRTGKSTTSRTVQQPTKVKAWPAMMLLFLLHLTMVCAITCYILLWLMLPHNMFDCGLHMVACATTHQIWLWLVLPLTTFGCGLCYTHHIWLWRPATVHISTTTRQSSTLRFSPQ